MKILAPAHVKWRKIVEHTYTKTVTIKRKRVYKSVRSANERKIQFAENVGMSVIFPTSASCEFSDTIDFVRR